MPSIAIGSTLIGPDNETFKITDFLGNGAFGEVYRALGENSGTIVAAKLIPLGTIPSEESKTAILNEIRTAQEIEHPNIVRILFVSDGTSSRMGPYVFMEYVAGGNLAELLRKQMDANAEIPLNRAIEMMIDIAQGARAINAKVIHRDIKPDNILIAGNRLKIGDFGISKFVDESTRTKTFKGGQHIAYMAPEGWLFEAESTLVSLSRRKSASVMLNREAPQSKHTDTFGNARTAGSSTRMVWLKWIIISVANSAWWCDADERQGIKALLSVAHRI